MNTIQPPAVADANIPGVEFDENGEPIGYYTVEEVFDELDRKMIDRFGEYGRQLVNESRAEWNKSGRWHFDPM
jgi:hypothetical protein